MYFMISSALLLNLDLKNKTIFWPDLAEFPGLICSGFQITSLILYFNFGIVLFGIIISTAFLTFQLPKTHLQPLRFDFIQDCTVVLY